MIHKIEAFMLTCDNCGEEFEDYSGYSVFTDESDLPNHASESGWHTNTDYDYCDKCHSINDDDEIVVNTERSKK